MNLSYAFRFQSGDKNFLKIWNRNYYIFKKTWGSSIFWIIFEPLVLFLAIGYGLGAFIDTIDGMTYIEFFFPSVLGITGMMVSFFESSYGVSGRVQDKSTYYSMLLSPVSSINIVYGELFWGAWKGFVSVLGILFLGIVLGAVDSMLIVASLPMYILICILFSALGIIVMTTSGNQSAFTYFISGVLVPISFISSTYFPIYQLPLGLQQIAYLSPVTHVVELSRMLIDEKLEANSIARLIYVILLTYVCFNIAIKKMNSFILNKY